MTIEALRKAIVDVEKSDNDRTLALRNAVTWATRYGIVPRGPEAGKKFSFDGRPWMVEPYLVLSQPRGRAVFVKARQLEFSTMAINIEHYWADKRPYTACAHVFPTAKQMNKFYEERLTVIYRKGSRFFDMLANMKADGMEVLNRKMHLFRNSSYYSMEFTVGENGGKSEGLRSPALDVLACDERADFPADISPVLTEALSHSDVKVQFDLGTPTYNDTELDKMWKLSTMEEWKVHCKACDRKQPLTLDNLMTNEAGEYFKGCLQCRAELDTTIGSWAATNPDGFYRGFHLNQIVAPWVSAQEIIQKKAEYLPRRFQNEVMGMAFVGDEKLRFRAKVMARVDVTGEYRPTVIYGNTVVIGVDHGNSTRWIAISRKEDGKTVWLDTGEIDDTDINAHALKIAELAYGYERSGSRVALMLDSGYGKAQNQKLMKLFPHRAFAVFYGGEKMTRPVWQDKPLEQHVTIEHTSLCENAEQYLNAGNFVVPFGQGGIDSARWASLLDEFDAVRIEEAEIKTGGKKRVFITKHAHGYMAMAYALLWFERTSFNRELRKPRSA
jgi:hypothetical protein